MRNQNMKYTAAKCTHSEYGIPKGVVLFGEDNTIHKTINRHNNAHEMRSKT